MPTTNVVLLEAKFAEIAQTTQYTSPAGTRTLIDKFTATNVTAAVVSMTVNLVPTAGAAANSNAIAFTKSIDPGQTYTFPEVVGHNLSPGGFISTIAGTANALTIRFSGRQVT